MTFSLIAAGTLAQTPEVIRIAGDTSMKSIVQAWEARYAAIHPGARFDNDLRGTDMGMGMLYGGKADIALLGRESNQVEDDSFLHSLQYTPVAVHLMTGSLDLPNKTYAPVFYVAKDNPLTQITLVELDKVFGCGQDGNARPARTWGDLGLGGRWKSAPIHVYTFDTRTGTGLFLVHRLQGASKKMNWDFLREFADIERPDGSIYEAAEQTVDALLKDPFGLASASLRYGSPSIRTLALASGKDAPFVLPTRETLIDQTYPLARLTYALIDQPPGKPLPAAPAEFLRFVLSEEGQAMIVPHGFLPLNKMDAADQLVRLR